MLEGMAMIKSLLSNQFIDFVSETVATIKIFYQQGKICFFSCCNPRFSNFHWREALFGRHFKVCYYFL